ncbi:MAG: hypothetical protein C4B58_12275 [Deltaproteobacteria bacterium]|nr:MAG: hypothetical protein C4B58_12275 [Deltaproteobacteria bacterium]
MNWQLLIPLLITTGVAVLGWLVGHTLHTSRDRQNKRREIRVQYLIEAYRQLEAGTCRGPIHGTKIGNEFESAIADIQLFGTDNQARMAKELAAAIAECQPEASAGPLLLSLRDALRRELDLGALNEVPMHFRLAPKGQPVAPADRCPVPLNLECSAPHIVGHPER